MHKRIYEMYIVPKPKKQEQEEKPTRNWLELPSDIMLNILYRIGVVCILESAQKVCTLWRDICNDPAMWRVVYMDQSTSPAIYKHKFPPAIYDAEDFSYHELQKLCRCAVDRSRGQLVDLTVIGFSDHKLLDYVAERSSQLRRLEVVYPLPDIREIWSLPSFTRLSPLVELNLVKTRFWKHNIEALGRYCPLLKTLKLNQEAFRVWQRNRCEPIQNEVAIAIGENLPGLTHLELVGNSMQNIGLEAILNGCRHLESLDLRRCLYVDLEGELGKRCSKEVKNVRLPHESLKGWPDVWT